MVWLHCLISDGHRTCFVGKDTGWRKSLWGGVQALLGGRQSPHTGHLSRSQRPPGMEK